MGLGFLLTNNANTKGHLKFKIPSLIKSIIETVLNITFTPV